MKEIPAADITSTVARLFTEAAYGLTDDVTAALEKALEAEESPAGRKAFEDVLQNAKVAAEDNTPLCQDCGTAIVFLEVGQDVHITGGGLTDAVTRGVATAYRDGYLRKSVVASPFSARTNTGDNTPPVIHTEIMPGDGLKISVMPKGAGAENMSRLAMLPPAAGRDGIIDFVVQAVDAAGANPCPPLILGIGVGATADSVMLLAKKALLRKVGISHPDPATAALERDIITRVNALGIGLLGLGGRVTALAVHVETFPTHIASLPVAVNFQCHSARHREAEL